MECFGCPENETGRLRDPSNQLSDARAPSERDVVVHRAGLEGRSRARATLLPSRRTPETAGFARAREATAARGAGAFTITAAIEHGEVRVEPLQHDFGRVLVLAGLILPLAGLQLAFDVNLGPLAQVLLGDAH